MRQLLKAPQEGESGWCEILDAEPRHSRVPAGGGTFNRSARRSWPGDCIAGEATCSDGPRLVIVSMRQDPNPTGLSIAPVHVDAKGVPPDTVDKLRKMFAFMDAMNGADELRALTAWKPHTLTGNRKGTVSMSVTRNRRLTFRIDATEQEVCDVNLEDYH